MIIMGRQLRRNVVQIEIKLVERLLGKDAYIKVIEKRWITEEVTVKGDWRTYQLVWLVVSKIVHGSLSGLS